MSRMGARVQLPTPASRPKADTERESNLMVDSVPPVERYAARIRACFRSSFLIWRLIEVRRQKVHGLQIGILCPLA